MKRLYGARPGIRFVRLDDDAVVFNPRTWFSHVLNPSAAMVLEFLMERPRSREEIEGFLSELLGPGERQVVAVHVDRVVDDLIMIDLIHELPDESANRRA
jgi:PqqD family protein of HPr-rel-A system